MKRKLLSIMLMIMMVFTMVPFMGMEVSATVKDDGGTWLWPVKATKMVVTKGSGFGGSHKAIDIPATYGTTIRATREGIVYSIQKDTSMPLGNYVVIKHKKSSNGSIYYSHYAHLSSISVKKGQSVKTGDKIGVMGNTGDSYGKHLHFQITRNTAQHYGRTYPNVSLKNSPVVNTNIGNIKYTLNVNNTYTLRYSDGLTSTKNDSTVIPPTTMTKGVSSQTTTKKFTRTGYTYNYWYIFKYVNGKANYWCSNGNTKKWIPYDNIPSGYSKVKVKHGGKLLFNVTDTIYYTPVWVKDTYTLKYSDGLSSTTNDSKVIPPTTMTRGVSSATTTKKFTRTGYTYNYWYIFKYVNGKANYWCSNGTTKKFIQYDKIPSGYSKVKVKHGSKLNFNASVSTGSTIYYTPVWNKK